MRYSWQFLFAVIQKQETAKTINYKFLLVWENFKDIANRSDSEKTVTPKSFAYHHMQALSVKFYSTPIPSSAGVESVFS